MDVMRLEPTSYLPMGSVIDAYESMIWTERYAEASDFQMTTKDLSVRDLLPAGSLVSLRDTRQVQRVETHEIEEDDDGIATLTIKGRSAETFLEHREVLGGYSLAQLGPYDFGSFTPPNMCLNLLYNSFVVRPGYAYVGDTLPNVATSDSTINAGTAQWWYLNNGRLYDTFVDFLRIGGLGVRALRPPTASARITTFNASNVVSKTVTSNVTQLLFDIYDGVDRSAGQTARPVVQFSHAMGDLESAGYLTSNKLYKNVAYVYHSGQSLSGAKMVVVGLPGLAPSSVTGWDRQVLFVDASESFTADGTVDNTKFTEAMTQIGLAALMKNNQQVWLDGEISPLAGVKYGVDYFLGDKVQLTGKYGVNQPMVVSEYVRSESLEGERAWPGLIAA